MVVFIGIVACHYDSTFKSNRRLCLSILKQFGFGHRVMETRILTEVEEMINKVREQQGRPFDMQQLIMYCVANVIMSMLFGHRFEHNDPAFQELISTIHEGLSYFSIALELFPAVRILPYFKKMAAMNIGLWMTIDSFIRKNTTACLQVCISTNLHKHSAVVHN